MNKNSRHKHSRRSSLSPSSEKRNPARNHPKRRQPAGQPPTTRPQQPRQQTARRSQRPTTANNRACVFVAQNGDPIPLKVCDNVGLERQLQAVQPSTTPPSYGSTRRPPQPCATDEQPRICRVFLGGESAGGNSWLHKARDVREADRETGVLDALSFWTPSGLQTRELELWVVCKSLRKNGRAGEIRTRDLLHPKQAR
jgi:hypothetical protein